MQEIPLIPIGKTGKTHGVTGALKIFVDGRYLEDFIRADLVFLEIAGKHEPFFIEDIFEANDLLVKFEDLDTPEQAQRCSGKSVFLRLSDLHAQSGEDEIAADQYERYLGFMICDTQSGPIAPIEEVIELPQQFLAALHYQERPILIPMHPDLIHRIDLEKKEIWMDLPEGLLEI